MSTTTARRDTVPRTPLPACPSWCTEPDGHDWDSVGDWGRERCHDGPRFGPHLSTGAEDYAEHPGVLHATVLIEVDAVEIDDPGNLRELAQHALAAAEWLESQQAI